MAPGKLNPKGFFISSRHSKRVQYFQMQVRWQTACLTDFDRPHDLNAPKSIKTSSTHFCYQNPGCKFPCISLCSLHHRRAALAKLDGCNMLTESAWNGQERASGEWSLCLNRLISVISPLCVCLAIQWTVACRSNPVTMFHKLISIANKFDGIPFSRWLQLRLIYSVSKHPFTQLNFLH